MVSTVVKEAAFSFTSVTSDDILTEIKRLGIKKATQEIDIPTKIKTQFPVLIKILTAAELKVLFVMILKRQWNIKLKKKDCKIELSSYKLTSHITSCHISQKCIPKFFIEHLRAAASG